MFKAEFDVLRDKRLALQGGSVLVSPEDDKAVAGAREQIKAARYSRVKAFDERIR